VGRFDGSAAWITGGGSGLGRAMAVEIARQGADVAVSGRRVERLEETVALIEAQGRRGLAVPCDVSHEEDLDAAVDAVVQRFGRLDVAVANAGIGVTGRVERLTADDWRRLLDVNVVGVALTAARAIPHLRETRGRLALVGSVSAWGLLPGYAPYQASKAAVYVLGRTLALELARDGISVTTVQPGFVASEIRRLDTDGRVDPEKADPVPPALLWSAEDAARVVVRAIHRRRLVFTFTGHGRAVHFLGRHLPGTSHRLAGLLSGR